MLFIGMTVDQYLEILAQATPEDGPFTGHDAGTELNTAFAQLAAGFVAFVKVGREHLGYDVTRSTLEDVVHTLPATENPVSEEDVFAALQTALLDAMGRIPDELLTEADDTDGAPKES